MFEFFQVVDESHDDPTLFPVLSAPQEVLPIEFEPADGDQRRLFEAKGISVVQRTAGGWTQLRTFGDLRFGVVITEARVVVHCERWTKGGGWRGFGLGGLAVAVAANAVSHARAAHRRKGKVLVAQLRYPWLIQSIALSDKRGRPVALRLVVDAGTRGQQRLLGLDIPVSRDDPSSLAAGIAVAAARFRLGSGIPTAQGELPAWQRLAEGRPAEDANGSWSLPSAIPVGVVASAAVVSSPPTPAASEGQPAVAGPAAVPAEAPPVIGMDPSSPRACPACGHLATVVAITCPRCGLDRVAPARPMTHRPAVLTGDRGR
jgi:hypothetical protein